MFRLFSLPYLFTSGLLALAACSAPQSAPDGVSAEHAAAEPAPDEEPAEYASAETTDAVEATDGLPDDLCERICRQQTVCVPDHPEEFDDCLRGCAEEHALLVQLSPPCLALAEDAAQCILELDCDGFAAYSSGIGDPCHERLRTMVVECQAEFEQLQ